MNTHRDDKSRSQESEAILKRLHQETEPQTGAIVTGMAHGARRHFLAGDADPADRVEVVGTRIGRLAGLGAFVVLLLVFVVNNLLG